MKLYKLAKLVRSKNAGPFMITIDILFETEECFRNVLDSKLISINLISKLYDIPKEKIQYFACPAARAIKFSYPRKVFAGDFEDSDIFGCQYHAPLVNIDIVIS